MALDLADADGEVCEEEASAIVNGFMYFNIPDDRARAIVSTAMLMDSTLAREIVSRMTDAQKEFVTAWLICIVAADNTLHTREIDCMRELSEVCGLPHLTVEAAKHRLASHRGAHR